MTIAVYSEPACVQCTATICGPAAPARIRKVGRKRTFIKQRANVCISDKAVVRAAMDSPNTLD